MKQEFIDAFLAKRKELEAAFGEKHFGSYEDILRAVVEIALPDLDPERIHQIDDGDYQGTLVFVVAEKGYQPSTYYSTKVYYGSCSGCDTLQSIHDYGDDAPTPEQVQDYYTLALHLIERMKEV